MIDNLIFFLNNNPIFNGCLTMMMHIGGRYVSAEIPQNMERIFNKVWLRRIFVFSVAFMATRDIRLATLFTLLFIVLFKYLLDENSNVCILTKNINQNQIQNQYQNQIITTEELLRAKDIIKRYNNELEMKKIYA